MNTTAFSNLFSLEWRREKVDNLSRCPCLVSCHTGENTTLPKCINNAMWADSLLSLLRSVWGRREKANTGRRCSELICERAFSKLLQLYKAPVEQTTQILSLSAAGRTPVFFSVWFNEAGRCSHVPKYQEHNAISLLVQVLPILSPNATNTESEARCIIYEAQGAPGASFLEGSLLAWKYKKWIKSPSRSQDFYPVDINLSLVYNQKSECACF